MSKSPFSKTPVTKEKSPASGETEQGTADNQDQLYQGLVEFVKVQDLPVFPVHPETKAPFTSNGFYNATTDLAQIEKWRQQHGNPAWGMPTGERTGITVIDPDMKNGVNGIENWEQLQVEENFFAGDTVVVETKNAGKHEWYRGTGVKNTNRGELAEGVDTRGEGGYVVLPFSPGYRWAPGKSIDEIEMAPLPEYVSKRVPVDGPKDDKKEPFDPAPSGVPGTRHGDMISYLGSIIELHQYRRDSIRDRQLAWNSVVGWNQGNTPPLPDAELRKDFERNWKKWAHEAPDFGSGTADSEAYTWADAFGDIPEIDWLVEGFMPAGTVNVIWGEAGSKKTYGMMDLMACVATGRKWLGTREVRQGNVVFMDLENGRARLLRRAAEVIKGQGITEVPPITMLGFPDVKDLQAKLLEVIERYQAVLVVIDPFANLMSSIGGDENSKGDVMRIMAPARRVADATGATIIVLHHPNKTNKEYSGSAGIRNAADYVFGWFSKDGEGSITIKSDKTRDSGKVKFGAWATWGTLEPGGADGFHLTEVEIGKTKPATLDGYQYEIARYICLNGPSFVADIATKLVADGRNSGSVGTIAGRMEKAGLLYIVNPGAPKYIGNKYDLSDLGEQRAEASGLTPQMHATVSSHTDVDINELSDARLGGAE